MEFGTEKLIGGGGGDVMERPSIVLQLFGLKGVAPQAVHESGVQMRSPLQEPILSRHSRQPVGARRLGKTISHPLVAEADDMVRRNPITGLKTVP